MIINNNITSLSTLNAVNLTDKFDWVFSYFKSNEESDEIFVNNVYQLQVYNKNIIYKLRKTISNVFYGKSNYKKFLNSFESVYLKDLKTKNQAKNLDVWITTQGIIKQMEEAKNQISIKYNERICA